MRSGCLIFIYVDISRGSWTELLYASLIGTAKGFFKHVVRKNTLFQARRNISRHYDLVRAYASIISSIFLMKTIVFFFAEV